MLHLRYTAHACVPGTTMPHVLRDTACVWSPHRHRHTTDEDTGTDPTRTTTLRTHLIIPYYSKGEPSLDTAWIKRHTFSFLLAVVHILTFLCQPSTTSFQYRIPFFSCVIATHTEYLCGYLRREEDCERATFLNEAGERVRVGAQ